MTASISRNRLIEDKDFQRNLPAVVHVGPDEAQYGVLTDPLCLKEMNKMPSKFIVLKSPKGSRSLQMKSLLVAVAPEPPSSAKKEADT